MKNWLIRLAGGREDSLPSLLEKTPDDPGMEWCRIARLTVEGKRGRNEIAVNAGYRFRQIKLRSRGAGIEIRRWVLALHDGSIQDLSLNCLLKGGESRPMTIAGRRLMGIVVDYDSRWSARRSQIEIWAQT